VPTIVNYGPPVGVGVAKPLFVADWIATMIPVDWKRLHARWHARHGPSDRRQLPHEKPEDDPHPKSDPTRCHSCGAATGQRCYPRHPVPWVAILVSWVAGPG